MGTTDFVLREYNSWAGDMLQSSNGVFLYSRRAMYGSCPLSFAFMSNFLAIPTDFSANPLHMGATDCWSCVRIPIHLRIFGTVQTRTGGHCL